LIQNIFLAHAGRLFFFPHSGIFHVNIKSKNSSFECTVNVVQSGMYLQKAGADTDHVKVVISQRQINIMRKSGIKSGNYEQNRKFRTASAALRYSKYNFLSIVCFDIQTLLLSFPVDIRGFRG